MGTPPRIRGLVPADARRPSLASSRATAPRRARLAAGLALILAAAGLAPSARADFMMGQVVDANGVGVFGVDIDVKNNGSGGTPDIFNDGTDPNGFFLTTIPNGNYAVTFKPPPPPASTSLVLTMDPVIISGTTDLGVVQLPAGVAMTGRCVTTQGFPVGSAGIDVKDGITGTNIVLKGDTTNVFGEFSIAVPPGPIDVEFLTKGVFGFTLAPRTFPLDLSVDTDLGDVVLQEGFTVTAKITNAAGAALANVDTDVLDSVTGAKIFTPNDNSNALGVVNLVLEAGTYDVVVQPPLAARLVTQVVPGVAVAAPVDLGVLALQPGFLLTGTVTADGLPLAGIDVDVEDPLTGLDIPLTGDSTNAASIYQTVVPPGTWDVRFRPPTGQPYDVVLVPDVIVAGNTNVGADLPFCPLPCGPAAITSVSPGTGHPTGGTRVTILGQNYRDDGSIDVTFGGVSGTVVQVLVPDTLLVDTPAGASGAVVDVALTSSNGPASLPGGFTYDDPPPPVLTGIDPASGVFHSPTPVTLTGADFDPFFPTTLTAGGAALTDVTWVDAGTLTAVVPAGAQGDVGDVVVTQDGASSTLPDAFSWVGTQVTSVTPGTGHPAVATPVTIGGSLFAPDTTATFGGVPATMTSVTPTSLQALVPPGASGATVDLVVTGADGTDTMVGAFTYDDPPPPVLSGVTPSSGLFHTPTPVTLTGVDLDPFFPTTVTFDGRAATDVAWVDATTMTATAPAGLQGAVGDVVLTQDGTSTTLVGAWSWVGTSLAGVAPDIGHPGLPTEVTLTGDLFPADAAVTFGGVPGSVLSVTPTTLVTLAPPGPSGTSVDIRVTGANGEATLPRAFHYEDPAAPVLAGTTPSTGLFHAPGTVVLEGQDFDSWFPIAVTFGGAPATDVTWLSDTSVSCTAPAGTQGATGDVVLTQNGHDSVLPGAWTWVGSAIASVDPAAGHPAVETPVTITGSLFAPDTTVTFGGTSASVVTVTSEQLDVLAPPGARGAVVDVVVAGSDGTDMLVGGFAYDDPPPPVLAAVDPAEALFHAPGTVTLTGSDFDPYFATTVTFGGLPATDVVVISPTTITATAPANTQGAIGDVVVTQDGLSSTLPAAFGWIGTSIADVTPSTGHPALETPVTISGAFFAADSAVSFGGVPATIVGVTPDAIDVLAPTGTRGAVVDVVVAGSDGTDTLVGGFAYDDPPPPVLAAIDPPAGLFHSPTSVTLTGADFDAVYPLTVTVGGLPAGDVVRVSDTVVTATVPANTQGAVGDVVLTQDGLSTTLPAAFAWEGTRLLALSPAAGDPLGGTAVTLTGEHLPDDGSLVVTFGGAAATVVSVTAPGGAQVLTPPGTPDTTVDVAVSGSNGDDLLVGAYRYEEVPPPVLAAVAPTEGLFHSPTAVTLTGADFSSLYPVTVTVGGLPATDVVRVSDTVVTATFPPNAQGATGDVVVTQNGLDAALPGAFTWTGTTLASIAPTGGHPAVETLVTLTGERFAADTAVTFGAQPATVVSVSDTTMTVLSPTGTPGAVVDVTATGADGTDTLVGAFTYDDPPPPVLAAVAPAEGLFHSPTAVTLTGTDFDAFFPMSVRVGGLPATQVTRVSSTTVTAVFPASTQGATGDVTLTQNGHTTTLADAFAWVGTELAGLAPANGHPAVETPVTISGARIAADSTVTFGGVPATVVAATADAIDVLAPTGTPGLTVDVTVSGTDGTDTLPAAFTYDVLPAPTVAAIDPPGGLFHAQNPVTITGTGFDEHYPLAVTVGGLAATDVVRVSDTVLTATVPPNAQGAVGAVVVTQEGLSGTLPAAFTWEGTRLLVVSPNKGHPNGGVPITLTGEHFTDDGSLTVTFGATPVVVTSVTPPGTLVVTSPAGPAGGVVDVTVASSNGTDTLTGAFTFVDPLAPTLTAVTPSTGLFHSPTPVTLTGEDFDPLGVLSVTFAGVPATDVAFVSDTQVTAVAPPGSQGQVADVVVVQDGKASALPAAFTWVGTEITSISPDHGHPALETPVALVGSFLAPGSTIAFGGAPGVVLSADGGSLQAIAPPGTPGEVVDVTVTGPDGTDTLLGGFRWDDVPPPTLASVDPTEALFHTPVPVVLTGGGFDEHYALAVTFDGTPATDIVRLSSTQVACTAPAGTQDVFADVVVTQNGESAVLADGFRWTGTHLFAVAPDGGHPNGGEPVTLTGEHFADDGATRVTFGGVAATDVVVLSETTLTVVTPPGEPGATVDVEVAGTNGEGLLPGAFTYDDPLAPTLLAVSPGSGLFHAATPVTLTGESFDPLAKLAVTFGGVAATDVAFVSPTTITCRAPTGEQGQLVDVTVDQDGHVATLPDAFGYVGTRIVALDPPTAPPVGGPAVTLTATFVPDDGTVLVDFGALAAEVLSVTVPDTIVVRPPAGLPGETVDVAVRSSNGEDVLEAGFTYDVMTLDGLSPESGPAAGGPPITITGVHVPDDGSLVVDFGGLPATVLSVDAPDAVVVELPAGARGSTVDVTVTGGNGGATLPASFTYAITVLASVEPRLGPPDGGDRVVILGEAFTDDGSTRVFFGDAEATVLDVVVPHTLVVEAPPGDPDAVVDVMVTSSNGADVLATAYTYGDFMLLLGDGVDGGLGPGDVDTLFFDALAGSRITLQTKPGKGSDLLPRMRLTGPDGDELLAPEASAPKGKTARVKNLTLPDTGRYRLELLAADGSAGDYRFRSKLRPVTKVAEQVFVNAATPVVSVDFGALPGWSLKTAKVAAKKSKKSPDVLAPAVTLTDPDGALVDPAPFAKPNKKGTKLTLKNVPLDVFGEWSLDVTGADGTTGEAKVSIRIAKPKGKPQVIEEG